MSTGCYQSEEGTPIVEPPGCTDADGDGYGLGDGCLAADCNDADPSLWDSCGPDCGVDPLAAGCACDAFEPEVCYDGPAGTAGNGQCGAGIRTCRGGFWTPCEGQVLPQDETCDYVDNDCDGVIDEGVQNACGNCDADCGQACAGVGCAGIFATEGGAELGEDGSVVLSEGADLMPHEIWIADSQAGEVARVDTTNVSLLGVYRTGPNGSADTPTAVAVDGEGSAYVVNSRQGQASTTVSKIYASSCPDADGDGRVETSRDDDPLSWGDDECVAWNAEMEDCGNVWGCGYGWSIALTQRGQMGWVALYQAGRVVEFDTETGEPTGNEVSASSPVALVVDADDNVWVGTYSRTIKRFTSWDPEDVNTYNLGAQTWASSLDLTDDGSLIVSTPLAHFDPETEQTDSTGWSTVDAVVDGQGLVWGAGGSRTLRRYDAQLENYDSFSVTNTPYQLAADRDGQVWASQQWGGSAVVVVDDSTGEEVATSIEGCGAGCLSTPILEGDPTGLRFRRAFGGVLEQAVATYLFDSNCGPPTHWNGISWEAQGGEIQFWARSANDSQDLSGQPWVAVGSTPPDAGESNAEVGEGHLLEVRAQLGGRSPQLERITARWSCFLGQF